MHRSAINDMVSRIMHYLCNVSKEPLNVSYNQRIMGGKGIVIQSTCKKSVDTENTECIELWAVGYGVNTRLLDIPAWYVSNIGCMHENGVWGSADKLCLSESPDFRNAVSLWTIAGRLAPSCMSWGDNILSDDYGVCMICCRDNYCEGCDNPDCINLVRWFACTVYFTKCCDLIADVSAYIARLSALLMIEQYAELTTQSFFAL